MEFVKWIIQQGGTVTNKTTHQVVIKEGSFKVGCISEGFCPLPDIVLPLNNLLFLLNQPIGWLEMEKIPKLRSHGTVGNPNPHSSKKYCLCMTVKIHDLSHCKVFLGYFLI